MQSKIWMYLRVFFPSWKFFNQFDHVPQLYFRFFDQDQNPGAWELVLTQPRRSLFNLLFNPEGNLFLAKLTVIENWMNELADLQPSDPIQGVSYELVHGLVKEAIQARKHLPLGQLSPANHYQFKLSNPEGDVLISSKLMLSEVGS